MALRAKTSHEFLPTVPSCDSLIRKLESQLVEPVPGTALLSERQTYSHPDLPAHKCRQTVARQWLESLKDVFLPDSEFIGADQALRRENYKQSRRQRQWENVGKEIHLHASSVFSTFWALHGMYIDKPSKKWSVLKEEFTVKRTESAPSAIPGYASLVTTPSVDGFTSICASGYIIGSRAEVRLTHGATEAMKFTAGRYCSNFSLNRMEESDVGVLQKQEATSMFDDVSGRFPSIARLRVRNMPFGWSVRELRRAFEPFELARMHNPVQLVKRGK